MNILQVHNKYIIKGGEWTVVNQEYDLLKRDHRIERYYVDNAEILESKANRLKLIFTTHYNRKSKARMKERLSEKKYDLMHVHNFFPLLSPSVFEAARETGTPSVMSLHNFRLVHPNGLLYHNGRIDERSLKGSAYRCVPDGVYRDSIFQTAVTAHMIEYHRKHNTWKKYPSAFIALSEFSKAKFVEGGLPEERILIKPNFLKDPVEEYDDLQLSDDKENMFFFAGRISYEKGVEELVDCWIKNNIRAKLVIAGDGPLREKLEKKSQANPGIRWLGQISSKEILSGISKAKALLFPTKCYEGQPLTLIEALSVGCPVITSKIGNPQNMIDHGSTGFHYKSGDLDELYKYLKLIYENPDKRISLSRNARKSYLENYTPEKNYQRLMEIYEQAAELEKTLSKAGSLP